MIKFIYTLFMTSLLLSHSFGQDYSLNYGRVSKADIDLTEYPDDPEAEAVVLFDYGESVFEDTDEGFLLEFRRKTRIKILSDAGIKWSEIEIPFYQEGDIFELVIDLEGTTYNFDGKSLSKTALDPKTVYKEKTNEYWNKMKFAFPNVKKGSIIEYTYRLRSPYLFNLQDWEFQWQIPVVYSEYKTSMIPFYSYTWLLQGASKFDVYTESEAKGLPRHFGSPGPYGHNTYHDMVYTYGMKNVPAFRDEEFITSMNDYIIKLDFQLAKIHRMDGTQEEIIQTWPSLIDKLDKHANFGKYIQKSEKYASKSIIKSLPLAAGTAEERLDILMQYVKDNINWNGINSKFSNTTVNALLKEKTGTSGDINLFAVGLLRAAGFDAYPVIISTRPHGKIKLDYPFNHFFNYVIILVNIDGKSILTDGTEILCKNNTIPPRCINDKGLIIQKNKEEWVLLEQKSPSMSQSIYKIQPDSLGFNCHVDRVETNYYALEARKEYGDDLIKIQNSLLKHNYKVADSSISVSNAFESDKNYQYSYNIEFTPETINDKIYISPFLADPITDNPLKQKLRNYPIDFTYPRHIKYVANIEIPGGYELDYTPKNESIDNKFFTLNYTVVESNNSLLVNFEYYFKNSVYAAEEYPGLKYYFRKIVEYGNEKVVLRKVE